jgi:hypothetical protein
MFLWGHFDLAVGDCFLAVGRVQEITTLEEVLDLAGGISGAYEPAVETTGCNSLCGFKSISECIKGDLEVGLMQYLFDVVEVVFVILPSLSVGRVGEWITMDVLAYAFEIYTTKSARADQARRQA